MTRRRRRLYLLLSGLGLLAASAALVLYALGDTLVFFYSPSDLETKAVPAGRIIRIGGLVEDGSLDKAADGLTVSFRITDLAMAVPVVYHGLLPDLFREGQGVVAEGTLDASGLFTATEVLAKHDETYMPPEVVDALKAAGRWQEGAKTP